MGEMRIMGRSGDVKLEWDPKDEASVAQARSEFDRLIESGFEAYKPGTGTKRRRVKKFDPKVASLVMAPGAAKKVDRAVAQTGGTRRRTAAMAGGPTARVAAL